MNKFSTALSPQQAVMTIFADQLETNSALLFWCECQGKNMRKLLTDPKLGMANSI